MSEFPTDEVLIARGKYSTRGSEMRAALKALREDVEAITSYGRLALRGAGELKDLDFAIEQSQLARQRIDQALERLGALVVITQNMEALRPLAWGKGAPE